MTLVDFPALREPRELGLGLAGFYTIEARYIGGMTSVAHPFDQSYWVRGHKPFVEPHPGGSVAGARRLPEVASNQQRSVHFRVCSGSYLPTARSVLRHPTAC